MHQVWTAAIFLALLGCVSATGTEEESSARLPGRSADHLRTLTVVLTADRAAASPVDTVEFTVAATNTGTTRLQLGSQCGPSMDVAIATPNASVRSAVADLLGPNGAFTCPLLPEHFAEPGQTRIERTRWVVAATKGTYNPVGALRREDGLWNLSRPVDLVVR